MNYIFVLSVYRGRARKLLRGYRLGDDRLTPSMRIIKDETVERALFSEFIDQFIDAYPEHHDLLRAVRDPLSLLDLITNLASRGAFPSTSTRARIRFTGSMNAAGNKRSRSPLRTTNRCASISSTRWR